MVFGSCPSRDCIEGIADGFVIKPFDPQAPVITIPFGEAEGKETYHEENTDFPYYPTAKAFYMKHAGIIIEYLRENPEKKVVYSRVDRRFAGVVGRVQQAILQNGGFGRHNACSQRRQMV